MKTAKSVLVCLASVGVLAAATSAQAIVYDLTSDHATGGLGTAPFGTVTLIQNGANVGFTVDLATGYSFVKTGAADNLYFKFNGIGITALDIVNELATPNVGSIPLDGFAGAFNGDGTGTFGFGVGPSPLGPGGGIQNLDGILTFTVLNATIAELTVPNELGNIFVADLLAPNGNTGPSDVSTNPPSVPDGGSTVTLLGAALAGLGGWRRLLRK